MFLSIKLLTFNLRAYAKLKPYLHLNYVLNWIIWKRMFFDFETVFTLNLMI